MGVKNLIYSVPVQKIVGKLLGSCPVKMNNEFKMKRVVRAIPHKKTFLPSFSSSSGEFSFTVGELEGRRGKETKDERTVVVVVEKTNSKYRFL